MSLTLTEWLDLVCARFSRDFADFEVYLFEGTQAELTPHIHAWPRPANIGIQSLDVAQLVDDAATAQQATKAVEAELKRIGRIGGRQLITIGGLNVMAWLFPSGLLQPVYRWLRSGNRVTVLIAPPRVPRRLPDRARLDDWRSALAQTVARGGPDRTITLGGVQP